MPIRDRLVRLWSRLTGGRDVKPAVTPTTPARPALDGATDATHALVARIDAYLDASVHRTRADTVVRDRIAMRRDAFVDTVNARHLNRTLRLSPYATLTRRLEQYARELHDLARMSETGGDERLARAERAFDGGLHHLLTVIEPLDGIPPVNGRDVR